MILLNVTPEFLTMAIVQLGHAARKEANRSTETVANICFAVQYMLTAFVSMDARKLLAKEAREAGFTVVGDNYGQVIQVSWGTPPPKKEGWAQFDPRNDPEYR